MKYFYFFILNYLLLTTAFPAATYAQLLNTFNFNIDDGLPSNHIYGVIHDRLGYLWIATDKGAVRYNGFEFKLFNLSEGISNEDIWELFEDKKGRIWLANISDEFGYLYNNKYHKSFLKGVNYTVYPRRIANLGNGIIFYSNHISGDGKFNICVEDNDTIRRYSVDSLISRQSLGANIPKDDNPTIIFNNREEAIVICGRYVFKISFSEKSKKKELLMELPDSISHKLSTQSCTNFDDYIVSFSESREYPVTLNVVNLQKHTIRQIALNSLQKGDCINRICLEVANKIFYVITDKTILKFEYGDSIRYAGVFDLKYFIDNAEVNESKIRTLIRDNLWGYCIGTVTNGLLLNYAVVNHFIREEKLDLKDYKCVGGNENISCWWNEPNKTLARIDGHLQIKRSKYEILKRVFNITPYNKDSLLVVGTNPYLMDNRTWKLSNDLFQSYGGNIYSTVIDNPNSIFFVAGSGFYHVTKNSANGKFLSDYLDKDRYRELVYDSLRKSYWAYNFDKLYIHNYKKDTLITKEKLSDFGVEKIEKIVIDNKYGNIFIKGNTNITAYDHHNNTYRELFGNINLKEATALIYRNTLIVAGRFGVLFAKILGPEHLSESLLYPNIKNRNYNYVYGCDAICGKLLLNTDKGTYSVVIPTDSDIINSKPDTVFLQNKFVVNYRDTIISFKPGDTLIMNQKDLRLQFDVIKPFGNGHIKYTYKLEGDLAWHNLNADELTLPSSLTPDKYYILSLKVSDNVWRSDNIDLHIYITPYWYQTAVGRKTVWLSLILLMAALFTTAVLITRRIVLKSHQKRTLRMEMELKSIYAQINPHFIFNTLNSALLLVGKNKTEEAYAHISKFSRLLRAYIKSSRNKLISIGDEINNLKDYIELQQTRFKQKFDYRIIAEDKIDLAQIMIPSLLLQPFVENAINHGILPKKDTGFLDIEFTMPEDNLVVCVIEDDGIGRKRSAILNENIENKDGSYGDLMIKDLISIFNKFEDMNIEIKITDKEDPLTGTIVTIKIKNPHHAQ